MQAQYQQRKTELFQEEREKILRRSFHMEQSRGDVERCRTFSNTTDEDDDEGTDRQEGEGAESSSPSEPSKNVVQPVGSHLNRSRQADVEYGMSCLCD